MGIQSSEGGKVIQEWSAQQTQELLVGEMVLVCPNCSDYLLVGTEAKDCFTRINGGEFVKFTSCNDDPALECPACRTSFSEMTSDMFEIVKQ